MIPTYLVTALVFLYGLVFGSFLNVVIHRLPLEMSIWRPRSHCPSCGHLVAWFDNVPLVSFVFLLGRCRHCREAISWRYPLVELATGLLLALVHHRFGLTLPAAEAAILVLLLVPLALIDLDHHLLPDVLTIPGIALGLAGALAESVWLPWPGRQWSILIDSAIGATLGAAIPALVIVVYQWLRGREGMGWGDVKLLAMLGAFLGWRGMLMTLMLGACAGAVVGLGLIALGRGKGDTELPFGTFLCAAGLVVLLWAPQMAALMGWAGE